MVLISRDGEDVDSGGRDGRNRMQDERMTNVGIEIARFLLLSPLPFHFERLVLELFKPVKKVGKK